MSTIASHIERIKSLKAADVVRDDYVREQFIYVYNSIWGEGGEAVYEREAIHARKQIKESKSLVSAEPLTVFMAFIDLAVRNLSLAGGAQALCYLLPRGGQMINQGGAQVWQPKCVLSISGYGEMVLRKKAGQILYADNPVIVYEGDEFSYGEKDGKKYVNYACTIPRKSQRIIACFLKITRPDGSIDYSVMTEDDWRRLETFSAKLNKGKKNELYGTDGQIDSGFLAAKCIKHAFKSYPKIQIGAGSVLESDMPDTPEIDFDPYAGAAAEVNSQTTVAPPTPMEAATSEAPQATSDTAQGVVIEAEEDDTF